MGHSTLIIKAKKGLYATEMQLRSSSADVG